MDTSGPLSFLGRPLPMRFSRRRITIPAGGELAYDQAIWRDALVVVERGRVEIDCASGARRTFGRGDILCLAKLRVRVLRSIAAEPVVLVAVSRRLPC